MKTTDVSSSSFDIRYVVLANMGLRGIPRKDRRLTRTTTQNYLQHLLDNDLPKAQKVVQQLVHRMYLNADPDTVVVKLRPSDKSSSFQQASRKTGMEHGKKIADGQSLTEEELRYWIVPTGKNVHADGRLAPNVFELCKHVRHEVNAAGETVEVGEFEELACTLIALADARDYSPTLKVAIQTEMDRRKAEADAGAAAAPVANLAPAVVAEAPTEQQPDPEPEPAVAVATETIAAQEPVETPASGTDIDLSVPEPGLDLSAPLAPEVTDAAQPEVAPEVAPTETVPDTPAKGKRKTRTK